MVGGSPEGGAAWGNGQPAARRCPSPRAHDPSSNRTPHLPVVAVELRVPKDTDRVGARGRPLLSPGLAQ